MPIGQYNMGITSGNLPQSRIGQASQETMAPLPAMPSTAWGGQTPATNQLYGQAGSQAQSMGNVDMMRGAAVNQAALNLQRQQAQAGAGLGLGNLSLKLNDQALQSQVPQQNFLWQLLQGAMQ